MKMSRTAGLSMALVLLLGGFAAAGEFDDPGGYLIIGGLTAFEQFQGTDDTDISNSMGVELRGGYRFLEYLSAELELDWLSGFDFEVAPPAISPRTAKLTIDGGQFTANVKAYLPFGRIQPYGLFGLGLMYGRVRSTYAVTTVCSPYWYYWYCSGAYAHLGSSTEFLMKYGGGLDIYLTDTYAISLDAAYVQPFGKLDDLRNITFNWGFLIKFD